MNKMGNSKRILWVLFSLSIICVLLQCLSLTANAEGPSPDHYITLSGAQYRVCTEESGAGTLYNTFQLALSACTSDTNGDGTLVIQLGATGTPLSIKRGDGALISATYTGSVNIEYSGSETNGLSVASGVTAKLRNFTLTNSVVENDGLEYRAITVANGGSLDIENGTNITVAEGTAASEATSYGIFCSGGIVNVTGDVSLTAYKDSIIYIASGTCTLGGNAETDTIYIMQASHGRGIYNFGTINIGSGVEIKGGIALDTYGNATITGGNLSSSNENTITNNGTINISGGTISNTTTDWHRALENWSGTATISGGSITSTSNECIYTFGNLSLKGNCEVSCTSSNGMAIGTNSNMSSGRFIKVEENASVKSNMIGIANDSGGKCALTISGGTITAGTEKIGGTAVRTGADSTISGGMITAEGPSCTAVINSSAHALDITEGNIKANGPNCTGVSNSTGTVNYSGGNITSISNEANSRACGVLNTSYSNTQFGTFNVTGGTITAKATDPQAIVIGAMNSSYGVLAVSDGTVESLGTYGNSSAIFDESSSSPGGIAITSSAQLKSASQHTILSNPRTVNTGAFSYFGTSFYNSDHAKVAVRGIYDADSQLYIVSGTNFNEAKALAVPDQDYSFVKWTSDQSGSSISTVNETAISSLSAGGNQSVYLLVKKPPVNAPAEGSFADTDLTQGKIGGTIAWKAPESIADIDSYQVFWGTMQGQILTSAPDALATTTETSATIAPGTLVPSGAEYFLIFSHNEGGNSTDYASVRIKDCKNFVTLREGSLGSAGDKQITGLKNGAYYKVIEYKYTDDTPMPAETTYYAKSDGTLSSNPADAGPLNGTLIADSVKLGNNDAEYMISFSRVILAAGSLGTAGDSSVTGLKNGLRYIITSGNETWYTNASGSLSQSSSDSAPLNGDTIYSLTNGNTYDIRQYLPSTVILGENSLGTAGDNKITGLTSGVKYKIENVTSGITYYTVGSALSETEGDIAGLEGAEITGLTNGDTYVVTCMQVLLLKGSLGVAGNQEVTGLTPGKSYFIFLEVDGETYLVFSLAASDEPPFAMDESTMEPLTGDTISGFSNGMKVFIGEYTGETPLDENYNALFEFGSFTSGTTVNDWNYHIVDSTGNLKDGSSTKYLAIAQKSPSLVVSGDEGEKEALQVKSKNGSMFRLSSFDIKNSDTTGGINGYRILGYLHGSPVDGASKTVSVAQGSTTTVSFTEAAWSKLDAFQIIPLSSEKEATGLALQLDNLDVAVAETTVIPGTHSVSGTVKDDTAISPLPVSGATVKIMQGNTQYGSTATTKADGRFTVTGVPDGTYNLVVTKEDRAITKMIAVNGSDYEYSSDIVLPTGKKNSRLEIASDTPNVVVGYLDQQFTGDDNSYAQTPGNTVDIKLTVDKKDESSASGASEIENTASGKTIGLYLDMTLIKTLSGTKNSSEKLSELGSLLKIIVPYDLSDKTNVTVYRYHNGIASAMSLKAYSESLPPDECYMLNPSANEIIIWAKNFSTYAIAYGTGNNSGINTGSSTASRRDSVSIDYSITASVGSGGSISPSGSVKVTNGGSKTFDIKADSGYFISDVLVDGKSIGAVDSYTFSNVIAAHTIRAVFLKVEGLPYYLDGGNKKFIGFSSDASGAMKYISPKGSSVLFAKNPKSFVDINIHWAKSYIDFVTERELFVGTNGNEFSPNAGMTRAMFAAVIGRLYERSYGTVGSAEMRTFTDCDYGEWYGQYVEWCAQNDIIDGVGGGLFEPDQKITRQEMATILYRFSKFLKVSGMPDSGELSYPDSGSIASWAHDAARYCKKYDIITGRESGIFAPDETATRAEVAAILQRFIESVING